MRYSHLVALACGYALDAALGDPQGAWHPVRAMGSLIARLEPPLRAAFPSTPEGERAAGAVLAVAVAGTSCATATLVLAACRRVSPGLAFAVEAVIDYQMIARRSLVDESTKVERALEAGDLPAARTAVSMIVGRDTAELDEAGVARAAVETVAENASDGVIAPLFYLALGGAPAGVLYKAVNTMDSMIGYKNDRYRHFGTVAARTDDMLNFVPARLSGALMCVVAGAVGLDGPRAWKVFRRDRLAHTSPNAGHTEAACAGALDVRLAGPNRYGGVLVDKPYLGDDVRPVEPRDIARANRLMTATATAALGLFAAVGFAVGFIGGRRRR